MLGRILDHGHPAERPFACSETCDGALRVGIDDRRVASIKMPMNRKAACERTFAAAALHRRHRDDRAHLSSVPGRQRNESSESMLSFLGGTAYRVGMGAVKEQIICGAEV